MSDFLRLLYRRTLSSGDPAVLPVFFEAKVIDRYRGDGAYQVIRTNTAGRVKKQGGWSIDVGIADDGSTVHASWGALARALPEAEREHWAGHVIAPPVSENFLRMQMAPGSCFDDGDLGAGRET